tara:strand:+ start:7460 stop:8224 length:765 start_codon:yes stop_codon:yes gene_type:complete
MYKYTFKTIILGDTGVGKTTLCNTLMRRQNPHMQYQPTIGIDFNAVIETIYNNTTVKVHLWDTAGQEKYRSIIKSYYRGTCGAILMYDITNVASFNHLDYWLNEFRKGGNCHHPYPHPVLLLGTKSDIKKRRKISYEQGQSFALRHGLVFREVNNYHRIGVVEEGFAEFLREIYNNVERERRGEYIPSSVGLKSEDKESTALVVVTPMVLSNDLPMVSCKGVQLGGRRVGECGGGLNIDQEVVSPSVCTKCDRG